MKSRKDKYFMAFNFFKTTNKHAKLICVVSICLIFAGMFAGCDKSMNQNKTQRTVVVYTSVDQVYSEKVFKAYEQETGVKVKPVFDIEANKTVGLVNRIIGEKSNPQADVFWNGEILQTIVLKESGVLEKASPENSKNLPASFIDKDGTWFGFGGRARVLIFNKTLISKENCPKTLEDFANGDNVKKTGIAYPIFGTTATHAAALYSSWGDTKAKAYYEKLKNAGVVILDGNGVVKDYVSQKKLVMGLTDTDDALSEMDKNKDLDILFLDQGTDQIGNLVIPNTVAKIKGGPNPTEAEKFIDYLLSVKVEQALVDDGWIQIPVNKGLSNVSPVVTAANIKMMDVDFNKAFESVEKSKTELTAIFIR
jgi:iron(III) transport system substrate-binding protein